MVALSIIDYFPSENVEWVSNQVQRDDSELNPSHLLGGKDLLNIGVPAGPLVGHLLTQLRARS